MMPVASEIVWFRNWILTEWRHVTHRTALRRLCPYLGAFVCSMRTARELSQPLSAGLTTLSTSCARSVKNHAKSAHWMRTKYTLIGEL